MKKYYIAYGSNMDEQQMAVRCRDAGLVGTGFIQGYELLFKGSLTGCYATIEPKEESTVPVTVWAISKADEKRLDRYEGFPTFYYKKDIEVQMKDGAITGLVYIMHEDRHCGMPFPWYYEQMERDYRKFGFDRVILKKALEASKAGMAGMRVKLIYMEDPQAPALETEGTVQFIDDIGTIHVAWDTGCSLGLVPGVDEWKILN
ncbi:DUF4314 domain-containing protein [Veillonella sp. KGMB01456]|uniref:DUF4314 domain-containing protein n=1 Tax=Veillonella sp. KGMB01456 TaxID=2934794 RepID=UPI001FF1167F|nr:DUF4314 domain-containing protein [Veillonella sp. KGMB01456]MCK0527778.1 DUF4314 domain-containing protein [Veillonella sp. KGMB01456]